MKTKGLWMALMALMICFVSNEAYAYDIEVKNAYDVTIYYNYINEGKELEVTYQSYYDYSYHSNYSGSVVIPDEVTFMNRTRKVTSIGNYAFYYCRGLTSVTIPGSVTSIGEYAFSYCRGLTSVTIPNSVTSIGNYAFGACYGLTSISVENGNTVYDSRDNCNAIINSSTNELIAGCKNTIIPNSVTSIGGSAFSGCSGLTSVTIPGSVTSIGNDAFYHCGLTSVTIGNSVTSIGKWAFQNCSGLTSVTIPGSVMSIGVQAFAGCNLESVISLIEEPFAIPGKAEEYYRTFSLNTFNNATLYVPVGTIGNYKATEGWKDFLFIEEFDATALENVTESSKSKSFSFYTIDGKRAKELSKGINIVRNSNGETKKVLAR